MNKWAFLITNKNICPAEHQNLLRLAAISKHKIKFKTTSIQVMQTLNMSNIARVDGFVTKDGRVVIIDPNTFSGMAPTSFLIQRSRTSK